LPSCRERGEAGGASLTIEKVAEDDSGRGIAAIKLNKKTLALVKDAGFALVLQAVGGPAGIAELAESRMDTGFSLRARLWHGCTCGCSTV
jgi:hypothetical protein